MSDNKPYFPKSSDVPKSTDIGNKTQESLEKRMEKAGVKSKLDLPVGLFHKPLPLGPKGPDGWPAPIEHKALPLSKKKLGNPLVKFDLPGLLNKPQFVGHPQPRIRRESAFHVTLILQAIGDNKVTVNEGYVYEILPTLNAGVSSFVPTPLSGNARVNKQLVPFEVTDQEFVCVHYTTTNMGVINSTVTLVVGNATAVQTQRYIPPCGEDTTGQTGSYYWPLAQMNGDELIYFHNDDHIYHPNDRAAFVKQGADHDIIIDYEPTGGRVRYKSIAAGDNITIDDVDGVLTFNASGGGINMHVVIEPREVDVSGHVLNTVDPYYQVIVIRNGSIVAFYDGGTLASIISKIDTDWGIPLDNVTANATELTF